MKREGKESDEENEDDDDNDEDYDEEGDDSEEGDDFALSVEELIALGYKKKTRKVIEVMEVQRVTQPSKEPSSACAVESTQSGAESRPAAKNITEEKPPIVESAQIIVLAPQIVNESCNLLIDAEPVDSNKENTENQQCGKDAASSSPKSPTESEDVKAEDKKPLVSEERHAKWDASTVHIVFCQKVIRTALARMSRHQKRTQVVKEVLQSERKYVWHLKVLKTEMPSKILGADLLNILRECMACLEVITGYHILFLNQLEKRVLSEWNYSALISDLFLNFASYLKSYRQYVTHYQQAVCLMARKKNNDEFSNLLESLKSAECQGKNLKDYLIMPVQRIPRYLLLLRDILKETPTDHRDHDGIEKAIIKMESIGQDIENASGRAEKLQKLMEFTQIIQFPKNFPRFPLLLPHRKYEWEKKDVHVYIPGSAAENTGPFTVIGFNDLFLTVKRKASNDEMLQLIFAHNLIDDVVDSNIKTSPEGGGVLELKLKQEGAAVFSFSPKCGDLEDVKGTIRRSKPLGEIISPRSAQLANSNSCESTIRTVPISPQLVRKMKEKDKSSTLKQKRRKSITRPSTERDNLVYSASENNMQSSNAAKFLKLHQLSVNLAGGSGPDLIRSRSTTQSCHTSAEAFERSDSSK